MGRGGLYSLSLIFVLVLPFASANISHYDDYWSKKAAEAWNRTLATYEPMPAKVVSHFNEHTHRYNYTANKQSRGLSPYHAYFLFILL